MEFYALFFNSYHYTIQYSECSPSSRLEWIGEDVFGLTTYESEHIITLASGCLDLAIQIASKTHKADCVQYYATINLPFFMNNTNWGASIRSAWFEPLMFDNVFWTEDGDQIPKLKIPQDRVLEFFESMLEFSKRSD